MVTFSRRSFLRLSAGLTLLLGARAPANGKSPTELVARYPVTIDILEQAHHSESVASHVYRRYTQRALLEGYDNIAYLFHAYARSERIHADNYLRLLQTLGTTAAERELVIKVADTKANLRRAAAKELEKIRTIYPGFVDRLEQERYEAAIVNCMYAWKSHRQHEEQIQEILTYSGLFFGSVARRIEGMDPDFHVCEICGSTIDEVPHAPCTICNHSATNYRVVERPSAAAG